MHLGVITSKKVKKPRSVARDLAFDVMFGASNLLTVSFLYRDILLAGAVLVILAALALFYRRSRIMVPVFIFGMVFGTFAEVFAVHLGAWSYASPDFLGVPIWLFVLWGNAGLLFYMVAMEFERLGFCR
jgi:uncharacterized membrane protein YoaT (DUF817 family)